MALRDRQDAIGRVPLGLITWLNFPSRHGVERVIAIAHQAGLEVLAWVPDPAEAVRLARAGADAFCVDDVPGVLAALAGSGQVPG
jgi:glycerophosphoryl diester phosphodiesterase